MFTVAESSLSISGKKKKRTANSTTVDSTSGWKSSLGKIYKQNSARARTSTLNSARVTTGSPSSKYEHRRTSALLSTIQNIRICMKKKPIVSVTYENERISIKNSLPYLNCVLRLSCVVHGPIYDRFMGLCKRFSVYIKV